MFRIVCDPSSGNIKLYLTELDGLRTSSQPAVPYTHTHTTSSKLRYKTPTRHTTNICESLRIISVKYSSVLPDDDHIRSETCWSDF